MDSIIAVQGLGASPYYTWVKKVTKAGGKVEEVMWLRDLLPDFVPNARIATFSYLSDWFTYKKGAKTSIRELGEQLLAALHHDRLRIKVRKLEFSMLISLNVQCLGISATNHIHWAQHGWACHRTGSCACQQPT